MKACMECRNPIVGRSDKKFCSDLCRNAFNNKLNADTYNVVRNTNNRLRRNHRILTDLCPDEKAKVSKKQLNSRSFDFNLVTSIRITQKGTVYHFVYDYGYLEIDHELFLIVKDDRFDK